jgi:prepilin-type N-terminal cleavage/methylation domain-containing protein
MRTVGHCPKRSSGFTLAEVLVSVVIFLIVSLGIAGVLRNYVMSEKTNDGRASLDRMAQVLSNRFADEEYCSGRLAGVRFSEPFPIDFTDIGLGPIPTPPGDLIPGFGLGIRSIRFTNRVQQTTPVGPDFFDTDGLTWHVFRANPSVSSYIPIKRGSPEGINLQDRESGSLLLMTTTDDQFVHGCMSEARFRTSKCAAVGKYFSPLGNRALAARTVQPNQNPPAVNPTSELPDNDGCVSKKAFSGFSHRGDSILGPTGPMGPAGASIPGPPGPPGDPGPGGL